MTEEQFLGTDWDIEGVIQLYSPDYKTTFTVDKEKMSTILALLCKLHYQGYGDDLKDLLKD